MTKRFSNFIGTNSKKLKTDDNLDDLWGDDLDVKDVDDCFMLATQICKQDDGTFTQRNNVSILPPYNIFKTKPVFSSTQSDPELGGSLHFPSTSKAVENVTNGMQEPALSTRKELMVKSSLAGPENGFKRTRSFDSPQAVSHFDSKIKKLQEQCFAKEGEVSILRSQLKALRESKEIEQSKRQKEWAEKLSTTTKQLSAVRSELDFKNLEIANLKQKVTDVTKFSHLEATFNSTQSPFFKQPKVPEKCMLKLTQTTTNSTANNKIPFSRQFKVQPLVETQYPLQSAVPESVFAFPKEEKYLVNIKNMQTCRNTIPFLQNQMSQELIDKLIRLQPKVSLLNDGRRLNFDYVYCEMSKLMKCNLQEIEAEENYTCINKIVCVSEQLLFNLYEFLQELERSSPAESSGEVNVIYLEHKSESFDLDQSLFNTKPWCENEMGINAKQSIMCLSEILPHSNYLRGYLLQNKPLIFKDNEEYLTYLPSVKPKLENDYRNKFDYFHLVISLVTIIGKLKKANSFPGFLSSVTVLLNKICLCSKLDETHSLVYRATREIIFSGPNIQVLLHFTEFLKNASLQKVFVEELCKMPSKVVVKVNQRENKIYHNQDACVLHVLCILLEDRIRGVENLKVERFSFNITKFILNSIECNPRWLFYQEEKYCDCLCKIVKLCVDVMYETVEMFYKEEWPKPMADLMKHSKILKSGLEILHILNFKMSDMIVKYLETYAYYKDIIKALLHLRDTLNLTELNVELLERINVTDEIPVATDHMFSNIPLWD